MVIFKPSQWECDSFTVSPTWSSCYVTVQDTVPAELVSFVTEKPTSSQSGVIGVKQCNYCIRGLRFDCSFLGKVQ